jgi:NADP-dependent 3-hydroxy acid dehydrogenase YdfG
VTGATVELGLATAKEFSEQGAKVAISGGDQMTLNSAKKEIGNGRLCVKADTLQTRGMIVLVGSCEKEFREKM